MGALDRIFTYARGDMLSEEQFAALRLEALPHDSLPKNSSARAA